MKCQLSLLIVLMLLCSVASAKKCCNRTEFRVYDATAYRDKPDLSAYGIHYLPAVSSFWRPKPPQNLPPSSSMVRRAIGIDDMDQDGKIKASNRKDIYINVEHWPIRGDINEVYESLTKYKEVIKKVKAELPGALIGLYSLMPIRDYWRAIKPEESAEFKTWREENNRLSTLVSEVDFLLPSLYTFYPDEDGWEKYAISNLLEARRISQGKPVYAFLWPQYHDSNFLLNSQYIPRKFWRKQLEIAKKYADGVVIWGGWSFRGKPHILEWKNDMGWWQETLDWLRCDEKIDSISTNPSPKSTLPDSVLTEIDKDADLVERKIFGPFFDGGTKFYRVVCENGISDGLFNDGSGWRFRERNFPASLAIEDVLEDVCLSE